MKRLLRNTIFLSIALAAGFVVRPPAAVHSPVLPIPYSAWLTDIAVGERAELSFKWMGVVVAHGEILLKEQVKHRGRDVWHVVVTVQTNKFLSILFPVYDEYHSFIDVHTLQSLRFEKIISEGTYRADEVVEFDHEKKVGYYFSRRNKSEKTFATADMVQDPISAVYWFRTCVPMTVGRERRVTVNYEERNWNIDVNMVGREDIEVGRLGRRRAIKMKPIITNLNEHIGGWTGDHQKMLRESRITIWADPDQDRIPMRLALKVPFVGTVKIDVEDYKRLPALAFPAA